MVAAGRSICGHVCGFIDPGQGQSFWGHFLLEEHSGDRGSQDELAKGGERCLALEGHGPRQLSGCAGCARGRHTRFGLPSLVASVSEAGRGRYRGSSGAAVAPVTLALSQRRPRQG